MITPMKTKVTRHNETLIRVVPVAGGRSRPQARSERTRGETGGAGRGRNQRVLHFKVT